MKHPRVHAVVASLSFGVVATAFAQVQPMIEIEVGLDVDSGPIDNGKSERGVIYSTAVQLPSAAWIRLMFDDTTGLGAVPPGGEPTIVRITSLDDGASQSLNARHLKEWSFTSAYFNGGFLLIDVLADPDAAESRVSISRALIGPRTPTGQQTICGPLDDRLPSDDPRTGRLMPIGCSAWIIDDMGRCLLTAGHCAGGAGSTTMQFNVPLSDSSGGARHPGPEDQYAIDQESMQSNGGQGVGNDWAYFGCFTNPETGLTPAEAQKNFFVLVTSPPPVSGQNIRVTGYGVTGPGVPVEWNRAQKTHTGPYVTFAGSTIQYSTDTTGGNSGSPVMDEETGLAIGIHTHGGCNPDGGGANSGTGSNNSDLRAALGQPCGICAHPRPDNDLCADATSVGDGSYAFDTISATTDGGTTGCGVVSKDIWYDYTAPCTGVTTASTCDADFNTRLALYAADDCGGNAIGCDDDGCDVASSMAFPVEAGERYLIRVGGRSAIGTGTLVITCGTACAGDIDMDGAVAFSDILAILGAWGNPGGPEDVDGDGIVGFGDVLVVLAAWGPCGE